MTQKDGRRDGLPPKPTPAELSLLKVLWQRGSSTVLEVQLHLESEGTAPGYTTVLKLLQIMAEKGLVTRHKVNRSHVYQASFQEEQTQRQLVGDLLDRAFGGSASKLVLQALSAKSASAQELAEIRSMLDAFEEKI
jgi:BlaI family penicillinase repressor